MRAVIVYESQFGNIHQIAEAIGEGFGPLDEVAVVPVGRARPAQLEGADVVVGGPTHAHGMTWAGTRRAAADQAARPGAKMRLDPDAGDPGVRDWLTALGQESGAAAAFDTRAHRPAAFTGVASRGNPP
jgi:hypothetical protein